MRCRGLKRHRFVLNTTLLSLATRLVSEHFFVCNLLHSNPLSVKPSGDNTFVHFFFLGEVVLYSARLDFNRRLGILGNMANTYIDKMNNNVFYLKYYSCSRSA